MANLPFELSEKEIGALMCGVAADNVWKRGKRDFMMCSRNLFGINLSFREKGTQVALSCPNWRIGATVNYRSQVRSDMLGGVLVKAPTMHIPYSPGPTRFARKIRQQPVTVIREAMMFNPVLEIYTTMARFERDWVLLRMFSSEWAEHATG